VTSNWGLEDYLAQIGQGSAPDDSDKMTVVYVDLENCLALGYQANNKVVFVGEQFEDAFGFKSKKVELEVDKTFESNLISIGRAFRISFDCDDQDEIECAFAICAGLRLLVRESKGGLSLAAVESFIKGAFNRTPMSKEVGLFGELLAIYMAKSSAEAVKTWHATNFDTYDFGNSRGYLEVKTTSTSQRAHWLSLGQVQKVPRDKVTICSYILNLIPDGTTIEMLVELLVSKIPLAELKVFSEILSQYPLHTFTRRFDLSSAVESMKLYALEDLPIDLTPVKGVLNQKWLVDFEQLAPTNRANKLPFTF
jgi:hypothetical protein